MLYIYNIYIYIMPISMVIPFFGRHGILSFPSHFGVSPRSPGSLHPIIELPWFLFSFSPVVFCPFRSRSR